MCLISNPVAIAPIFEINPNDGSSTSILKNQFKYLRLFSDSLLLSLTLRKHRKLYYQ